ncbi:MAG: hypothetical protein PUF63_04965 [Prevotella sp.]|nr:hypothetical protein [Prevotella sp.]
MAYLRTFNLALSSLLVMGLAACSSDDAPDNGGQQINTQAEGIGVLLNETAGRVTNFTAASGAKAFTRAMPTTAPTIGLTLPTKPSGDGWDPYQGDAKLTANSVYQSSFATYAPGTLDMNGKSLLLKHSLTLKGLQGGGTIYVSGNTTLTLDGVSSTGTSIVIYKGGKLVVNGSSFTVEKGASLMAQTTFYKSGDGEKGEPKDQTFLGINLTNNGTILTANELHANNITLGDDSKTQVGTNLTAEGTLTAGGQLSAQIISATDATVTGTVVASKLFSLSNSLTVDGATAAVYGNYIKAGQYDDSKNKAATFIRQTNGSNIYVGNNGLVNTYTYYNTDGKGSKLNLADAGLAVLETKQIVTENTYANFIATPADGLFGVYFKRAYKGSVADANLLDWDDFAFQSGSVRKLNKENDFADITIPADESIKCLGFNPDKQGTKTTANYQLLRPTAEVAYGINDTQRNGRSATAVVVDGNNVYVSYHTNGNTQSGMLDYIKASADGSLKLNQSISAYNEAGKGDGVIDWNNIVLDKDQNKLVGIGNSDKGGVITTMALKADGSFNTTATSTDQSLSPLKYTVLQRVTTTSDNGKRTGDGNAVIVNGNYYQAATTYGIETFDRESLAGVYVNKLDGRGKYIAQNGSNVYVSYLASNPASTTTEVGLKVNSYASNNYRLNEVASTIDAGKLTPNNGKNVMAVDGNDIYVCLGANGLAKYTNGTLSGLFIPKDATYKADAENTKYAEGTVVTRGYCNGVCVKGDKIYIAYGSLGVIVINKSDMNATTADAAKETPEVARYTAGGSANFVTVDDNNNIYVAFGKSYLKVLKLQAYKR